MIELNNKLHTLIPSKDKNVVVIGYSATGKTVFADMLKQLYPSYKVYHTDDYMDHGFVQSLYELRKHVQFDPKPKIIEGIQGVRLLRKGLELNDFFADVVFIMSCDKDIRMKRYLDRKLGIQKIKYLNGFDSMLDKIYTDYIEALNKYPKERRPRICNINTSKV